MTVDIAVHRAHKLIPTALAKGIRNVAQDFTRPAINDKQQHCESCGRDNTGYEGDPCADECPMYWEELGIAHPDYPKLAA